MEGKLEIKGLTKGYGKHFIFNDFSISFQASRINCILGPSGCGKTTLLNIISKLSKADSVDRNDFDKLDCSYVFQESRLLPWKTSIENLQFPLKDKLSGSELRERSREYLEWVELGDYADYYPHSLSGGMKQRLSLARGFSFPSRVILMDEPFKGLDPRLKKNLEDRFLELWEKEKRTVVFVTHDVDEALKLGSNIMVFSSSPVRIIREFREPTKTDGIRQQLLDSMGI